MQRLRHNFRAEAIVDTPCDGSYGRAAPIIRNSRFARQKFESFALTRRN
jgi:hypothetical protein